MIAAGLAVCTVRPAWSGPASTPSPQEAIGLVARFPTATIEVVPGLTEGGGSRLPASPNVRIDKGQILIPDGHCRIWTSAPGPGWL
jgi:hypothetical protein